ncbi:outer membrane lipoprotein-sorting protein [bacterium]|nr:outer membrane lipoprotein-sorting protein [bacterium]
MKFKIYLIVFIWLLGLSSLVQAQEMSPALESDVVVKSGNELLRKIDAKLMPESYEAYRKIINIEPNKNQKEYIFYTLKKKNKIALLYLSPASDKGKASLRIDDSMWLYLPAIAKPIRIAGLQSIVGGVFNNADIMMLEYHKEYNVVKMEAKNNVHLLELKAKTRSATYARLQMWVSKEDVNLQKVECYSTTGILLKTLEFKKITDFSNGLIRPAVIETHSPLYKGYKSIMIYKGIKARTFSDEVFTLNYLPRLEELR